MDPKEQIGKFREVYNSLREEIGKVIVGQDAIVDGTLNALFANGHVLLEGVPGLGKTLLVRTLSQVLALSFKRILKRQRVDDRGEHAGVVSSGAVHAYGFVVSAAPDVTAADHYANLEACISGFGNLFGHVTEGVRVEAEFTVPFERLTAQLEQDTFIRRHWLPPDLSGRKRLG